MEKIPVANEEVRRIEIIRESLDLIDFELLRNIFDELLKKCSVDISEDSKGLEKRRFIDKTEIQPFLSERNKENDSNTIAISWNEIINRPGEYTTLEPRIDINPSAKIFRESKYSTFTTILKAVIHEEIHSTQFKGPIIKSETRWVSLTGIQENVVVCSSGDDTSMEMSTENKVLNEGLVEIIADRILEEYLRRVGKTELMDGFFQAYPDGRMLIDLLVHKISKETGVPPDTILDGLIRDSYSGISLLHGEILSHMSEDTEHFLSKYKSLDIEDSQEQYRVRLAELCEEYASTLDVRSCSDKAILEILKRHDLA